jgi:hypothetical protein
MNAVQDRDRQTAAYRRMKATIDKSHPPGWFVAIADDQIVAAAADFHSLEELLRARGIEPRNVLVAQAGADHPENVTIFI